MANGNHHIGVDGYGNITIVESDNVNIVLSRSLDFIELCRTLEEKKEAFENSNPENLEYREKIRKEVNSLLEKIEQFKQDVIRLAKQFSNIEINTKRLIKAKGFFDNGDFVSAKEALNTNDLEKEFAKLQNSRESLQNSLEGVKAKLKHISNEYVLKASLTALDFNNSGYLEETERLFDKAIEAFEDKNSLSAAAHFFSAKKYKIEKGISLYEKALPFYTNDTDLINAYYDIGTMCLSTNHEKARNYLEKAIQLLDGVNFEHPLVFSWLANSLHNLSRTYTERPKRIECLLRAMEMRKRAAQLDKRYCVLSAYTLSALGANYYKNDEQELFIANYRVAIRNLEVFAKTSDLSEIHFFQSNCFHSIITGMNLIRAIKPEEEVDLLYYRERFRKVLVPFEEYVIKHHKRDVRELGLGYYEFIKHFGVTLNDDPDFDFEIQEKARSYLKESLQYDPAGDETYGPLAFHTLMVANFLVVKDEHDKADELRVEGMTYLNQLKSLTPLYQKLKDMVEEVRRLVCECDKCVARRNRKKESSEILK